MSEKPARHQTSFAGMVGAMIVIVAAIVAFVLLRDLNRESADTSPEPLEWRSAVQGAQDSGFEVVHPSALPVGWSVTSVRFTPTDPPLWSMGMLTDNGAFIGVHQEDESVDDLLETLVDEDPAEGEVLELDGDLAGEWQTYTDDGGDVALVLERGEDVVLVYGSAPRDVVAELAASLTEDSLRS